MKNTSKKLLSVILAILIVVSTSVFAFAADDITPVIVISGMNAYPLVDENDKSVFPMEADVLVKDIPPIALSAIASIASGNDWSYLSKYGVSAIADLFAGMACDETGASVKDLHTTTFPEKLSEYREHFEEAGSNQEGVARAIADEIGWDNVYFMHYDWRISPMKHADDLDVYVKKAMAETGASKVTLVPMSFGGTIANAYLYKYGSDNIKNVVYASTAFNGVELVGRLLSGDPQITLADTMVYMAAFTQDIDILTDVLTLIAANMTKNATVSEKVVDGMVTSFIGQLKEQAYTDVFGTSLAHMKGLWTLMPSSYYEQAKAYMKSTAKFSNGFFDEIDVYMNNIQGRMDSFLDELIANGVNVYITGAYGYAGIPVTPACDKRTDTLIETYLMTGNCTVAPYGKTLSDVEYTKSGCTQHNHVSTDNIVDASTGYLPDNTWVIANMGHLKYDYGTRACDLLVWLAKSDEYVDVYSSEEYPQFMQMHKNSGVVTSLTEGIEFEDEKINYEWYEYIFLAFRKLVAVVIKIMNLV